MCAHLPVQRQSGGGSGSADGALAALTALGEKGTETSGTAATAASQIPAIQAAITKGANALVVSASDAAALWSGSTATG